MAPVGRTGVSPPLGAARTANAAQNRLHECARARHEEAGASYFAHGGSDEIGLDELDGDLEGGELGTEGAGPLLQEGFAAAISGEQWGGEEATKGAHV